MPRPISGRVTRRKVIQPTGAEARRGIEQRVIELRQRRERRAQHERHADDDMAEDQERDARPQAELIDEDERGEAEGERRQQQRRHEQQVEEPRPRRDGERAIAERGRGAEHERRAIVVQNATTRLVHAARCI